METLIATAGVILAAALSPGPNNVVVAGIAANKGPRNALPAVTGILLGSLFLLLLVSLGAEAAFSKWPSLDFAIAAAGSLYLTYLGLSLWTHEPKADSDVASCAPVLPAGLLGLMAFQLLNPKSWVLVVTAVSMARTSSTPLSPWYLASLFTIIPGSCLVVWIGLGYWTQSLPEESAVARQLNRVMGFLLLLSASLLLLQLLMR